MAVLSCLERLMDKYISPYLEIIESDKEIRYMGYALPLTLGEYEVLRAVLLSPEYIDKEKIREKISSDVKLSLQSIPVHIVSINKKSVILGGRKLIGFKRSQGYFIENDI